MASGKKVYFATMTLLALTGSLGVFVASKAGATSLSFHQQKLQLLQQSEAAERAKAVETSTPPTDITKQGRPKDHPRPESIEIEDGMGIPNQNRLSSLWFVDYAPNADQTNWTEVYMYAWKPNPDKHVNASLATRVMNRSSEDKRWVSPVDVGEIVITDISGLTGIVRFTTSSGKTGTFNIQIESWSFD